MPKRAFSELYGVTKNDAAIHEVRVIGLAAEVGLRKSTTNAPLRDDSVETVAFGNCEEKGQKLAVLEVILPQAARVIVVQLVLAVRMVLNALSLNLTKVDERRRPGGVDGSHAVSYTHLTLPTKRIV